VPHGYVVAEFSVATERLQIGPARQVDEAVGGDASHVPEEIEVDAFEFGAVFEMCNTGIGDSTLPGHLEAN
jgi:hypothetical protein